MDLRACGAAFVVAPVPARDGEPLTRVNDRFGVAVYPFADGQSFDGGEFSSPAHRLSVLGLLVEHAYGPAGGQPARAGGRLRGAVPGRAGGGVCPGRRGG